MDVLFRLEKAGTNVGLLRKPNVIKRTFEKQEIPVHVCSMYYYSIPFIVKNISFSGYTTFHSPIHQLASVTCFHILAFMNSAAMNIQVGIFPCKNVSVPLGIYLRQLLCHMETQCLTF